MLNQTDSWTPVVNILTDLKNYCENPKHYGLGSKDFLQSRQLAGYVLEFKTKNPEISLKETVDILFSTGPNFRNKYEIPIESVLFRLTPEVQTILQKMPNCQPFENGTAQVSVHHYTQNSLGGCDTLENGRAYTNLEHSVAHAVDELDRIHIRQCSGLYGNIKAFSEYASKHFQEKYTKS
jgi:hypothetical protein